VDPSGLVIMRTLGKQLQQVQRPLLAGRLGAPQLASRSA
jgi:hypothetical protein